MKHLLSPKFLLILIFLIGLFLRLYKLEIFYPWGHDQDLFAWIAKDIIVDGHLRLIGQETSITGVFIGPLFYYLTAFSMALFNMNPLAANIPTTIISLLTILSIYWVFKKFFGIRVGLIASFLYTISPGIILLDRWVVPTQPTTLWCVWFLYVCLSILKGKLPLVITGILTGLIWHVHVAFIPLFLLLPICFWLSLKKGNKFKLSFKNISISAVIFLILMLPFFAFELRHGFQQIKGLTAATHEDKGDVKGFDRVAKVFNTSGRSLAGVFLLDVNPIFSKEFFMILPPALLTIIFFLYKRKLLTKEQAIIFSVWIWIDLLAQFISKRPIPEYYFNNFFVVLFLVLSLLIVRLPLLPIILAGCFVASLFWFITKPDYMGGFLYKKQALEYIKKDSLKNGYKCIAVNHIEHQPNRANGYRYLFWYLNLHLITPGSGVPVYNLVYPYTISEKEISIKIGDFGIINPTKNNIDPNVCTQKERQLLPLWGFTN